MKDQLMHITEKEFQAYIAGTTEEYERERIELEIQMCEQCMAVFIRLVDEQAWQSEQSSEAIANQVVNVIEEQARRKKPKLMQRPFVQYSIAASITLLLVASGLMSTMTQTLGKIDESKQPQHHIQVPSPQPTAEPQADKWLDKANEWIQTIQNNRFK